MTAAGAGIGDILDALPSAVVVVAGDGGIESWNRAAAVLYGREAADAVGRPFLEVLFDPDDRASAAELLRTTAPWDGDRRILRGDGVLLVSSFRTVPLDGGRLAWIATDGIDQGLAEQERAVLLSAERAARDTAEEALGLVEAIVGSAPVGIAVFDRDLRIVRVNEAFAAISGAEVGGTTGDLRGFAPGFRADLRRVVTTGRTILDRPLAVSDEGAPRLFTASYYPVHTAAGTLVGAGATLVDVTATRRAEAESALLLARAESAQERLAILAAASTVLTATMDVDHLLAELAGVLAPGAADWCVLQLLDTCGAVEHVAVSHADLAAADAVARYLRTHPLPLAVGGSAPHASRSVVTGTEAVDGLASIGLPEAVRPRSGVAVPVGWRDQQLGVLLLARQSVWSPEDDDLDLAVEIAHRATLALGNALAYQREHEIAERLQRALLPSSLPTPPGIDLTVRYLAATDRASVGGDWYDAVSFDDHRLGVVIGDVVGHDIEATTVMGQVRHALRAYAHDEQGAPAGTVARLDRLIDALGLPPATCVLGVIDRQAGTFTWSNAGHLPPLLLRGAEARFLGDGAGMMLGVTAGEHMAEATMSLADGDVLVLYTDGLVERRGEPLDRALERLAEAAVSLPRHDGDRFADDLLAALVPPTEILHDDIAILVVGMHGSAALGGNAHRLELSVDPGSASLARGFAAGVLDGAGWGETADTAVLLVSELVTNALRHGAEPCRLEVRFVDDDTVEVVVEDGDVTPPAISDAGHLADSGRGLLLVDALAASWGVRPTSSGKQVWFRLRRVTG